MRVRAPRSRVSGEVAGANRARKSTIRADCWGPEFGSNSANAPPRFGPMRKPGISGDIFEGSREVGSRDPVKDSLGAWGASEFSVARFRASVSRFC